MSLYRGRITALFFFFGLETVFRVIAIFQGIGIGGFHDDHIFVIAPADIIHIHFQRTNRAVPVGVHRQTDDVVRYVALTDFIKPPAEGIVLSAFSQMKHDFHLLAILQILFQAVDCRIQQASQTVKFTAALPPAFAFRPQHAAIYLIANLHHIRQNAFLFKAGDGVTGVVVNGRFQLRIIHFFPGFRFELFTRVGPEIAVVEIQQQLHTLRFCPLRQRQRRRQIVITAAVALTLRIFRVNPQAQADIVHAIGLQNGDRILLLVVVVIKLCPVLFRIQQRRDISAFNKIRRQRAKCARLQRLGGQCSGGKTACQTNSKQRGC